MCLFCHHFVDPEMGHLEDGGQDFDHDPHPMVHPNSTKTLKEWKKECPDLFHEFSDGKIGPNSKWFNRLGKED